MDETPSRVDLTGEAVELLRRLTAQLGPVMFHQSGGCCDGSEPMCCPANEFVTGEAGILLAAQHHAREPAPSAGRADELTRHSGCIE